MFLSRTLLLCLILVSAAAYSQDNWHLSGFGSIGVGRLDQDNLRYMDYKGRHWNVESDSVLGLHLNGDLAERLSFTAQVISRGFNWDDTNDFEPQLDWLFLRYQLSSHWRLRVGRLRTPHYLYSETIDVGYSYPWARPPVDVYSPIMSPFSNFDGMDLAYITDWHDISLDVQLLGGRMKRSRDALKVTVRPMWGGNVTLQKDELTLRYGLIYDRTDIHLDSYDQAQALYQSYSALDPVFGDIATAHSANNAWYRYQSLGLRWEHQDFTATAEGFDIKNTDDGYTSNGNGWYLSGQYRLGSFTPYLVYGHHDECFNQAALQDLLASYDVVPAGVPGNEALDALRQISISTIGMLTYEQYTWTAGVRYDLLPDMALKAEWQRFHFAAGTSGQFERLDHNPPDHASLFTLILDAMF